MQVDSFYAHKVRRYKHVQNALGLNEASKLSVRIARVKVDRCLPFTVIRQRFLNLTLFHDVIRRKVALPPISQFAHPPIFTVDEKNRDDVSRLNSQFIRSAGIIRVHGYNLLDESGKRKTMSKASVTSDRNVKDREEKWINKKKKTLKPDKILLLVFWRFPTILSEYSCLRCFDRSFSLFDKRHKMNCTQTQITSASFFSL